MKRKIRNRNPLENPMTAKNLKLTYFDIPGGRGEPARLALTIGGVEFTDHRVAFSEWPQVRETAPFHACPFMEVDGQILAQSNTISRYVGRLTNLYPEDPWQAALCDEVLDAVEDMWVKLGPTMSIKDPEELKAARLALAEGPYTRYLQQLAKRLKAAGGQYFAGGKLTVADLQSFVVCRGLASGNFDHIPTDLVQRVAPELAEHAKRVSEVPAVRDYYARLFASA
jgi:prostaglandin-H2 D-isomerase / glutathione transferase